MHQQISHNIDQTSAGGEGKQGFGKRPNLWMFFLNLPLVKVLQPPLYGVSVQNFGCHAVKGLMNIPCQTIELSKCHTEFKKKKFRLSHV